MVWPHNLWDRTWPAGRFWHVAAFALIFGIAYTFVSELLNVSIRASWTFSEQMPVVSAFGSRIGISPLLQCRFPRITMPLKCRRVGVRSARAAAVATTGSRACGEAFYHEKFQEQIAMNSRLRLVESRKIAKEKSENSDPRISENSRANSGLKDAVERR